MFYSGRIELFSEGEFYTQVVTGDIQSIIEKSGISNGMATILLNHTTSGLFVLEHESGIFADLRRFIERIFADQKEFFHHDRGVDLNGKAHILNALFPSSAVLPITEGHLSMGEYQDVIFMDFQDDPKSRTISVFVYGDKA